VDGKKWLWFKAGVANDLIKTSGNSRDSLKGAKYIVSEKQSSLLTLNKAAHSFTHPKYLLPHPSLPSLATLINRGFGMPVSIQILIPLLVNLTLPSPLCLLHPLFLPMLRQQQRPLLRRR